METEHGEASEAPATERAGNRYAEPITTASHLDSTNGSVASSDDCSLRALYSARLLQSDKLDLTSCSGRENSNMPARAGWDRSVAGCRIRIMLCDTT